MNVFTRVNGVSVNNQNNQIQKIVIVGGGTAGWISGAALSRNLSAKDYEIVLVESDEIGTVGVGEATIPPIRDFHRMLGINEQEFVCQTQATFKLGIEFDGWFQEGELYFHPFGEYGRRFDSVPFHQYWMYANSVQDCGKLEGYSLCTQAEKYNKFAPTSTDPNSVLSAIGYAYHFDASLYARFLRSYSENLGVKRIEGKVTDVRLDSNTGFIESILLADGKDIFGDLFIDCTGFSALLIGEALDVSYEDWRYWLPVDSAWAVQTQKRGEVIPPYTVSTARTGGWQWRIPLQHRIGNGLVYSSQVMDDGDAQDDLLDNLQSPALTAPKKLRFCTGKRSQSWHKNCVAIGLSSSFLEPLESTSIHLIQTAIMRLIQLMPGKEFNTADITEYNQAINNEIEFVRDFIILHYHLNQRPGELWEHCRNMLVPDSLKHKMELFKNRGRVREEHHDLFKTTSWVAVMYGQGLRPSRCDPMANTKPDKRLIAMMGEVRRAYAGAVSAMPEHHRFIDEHCSASALYAVS